MYSAFHLTLYHKLFRFSTANYQKLTIFSPKNRNEKEENPSGVFLFDYGFVVVVVLSEVSLLSVFSGVVVGSFSNSSIGVKMALLLLGLSSV